MVSGDSSERDFVIQTARDADVKFVRLWFPDILGKPQGIRDQRHRSGRRYRQRRWLRRLGHRRFCPDQRERHAGFSRPRHVYAVAVAPPAERGGPDVLRHQETPRAKIFPETRGRS